MICEDCGETNKPGTEFCLFCGAYLSWQDQPDAAGAGDVTQPLPPPQSSAAAPTSPVTARPAPPAPTPPTRIPPAQAARATASSPPHASTPPVRTSPAADLSAAAQRSTARPGPPTTATMLEPGLATASAGPTAQAAPAIAGCPTCGRVVPDGRRFCGHCGEQFIGPSSNGVPVQPPTRKRDTWWSRFWDRKDRLARREYRRSLPPLYRWRRVIIVVLSLILIGGGLTLIGHSPKAFVLARYYDLRGQTAPVSPVTASTIPEGGSAPDTQPSQLVDGTAAAWAMPWTADTKGSGCGATPTTPVIQLAFGPTRIRKIDVRAGLLKDNSNRLMQFRPKTIWIAYGNQCTSYPLADVQLQTIELDTKVQVSSLRIGVQDAYPPAQPAGVQPLLAFTEITLLARPNAR